MFGNVDRDISVAFEPYWWGWWWWEEIVALDDDDIGGGGGGGGEEVDGPIFIMACWFFFLFHSGTLETCRKIVDIEDLDNVQ